MCRMTRGSVYKKLSKENSFHLVFRGSEFSWQCVKWHCVEWQEVSSYLENQEVCLLMFDCVCVCMCVCVCVCMFVWVHANHSRIWTLWVSFWLLGVVRGKAMVEHTLKTTSMTTMTTLRLVQAGSNARSSNYTCLSIISEHAQSGACPVLNAQYQRPVSNMSTPLSWINNALQHVASLSAICVADTICVPKVCAVRNMCA